MHICLAQVYSVWQGHWMISYGEVCSAGWEGGYVVNMQLFKGPVGSWQSSCFVIGLAQNTASHNVGLRVPPYGGKSVNHTLNTCMSKTVYLLSCPCFGRILFCTWIHQYCTYINVGRICCVTGLLVSESEAVGTLTLAAESAIALP